jgi:hypothetical protein
MKYEDYGDRRQGSPHFDRFQEYLCLISTQITGKLTAEMALLL